MFPPDAILISLVSSVLALLSANGVNTVERRGISEAFLESLGEAGMGFETVFDRNIDDSFSATDVK